MIAVGPGDAALVDVEPDARVRVDSGAEVRDADRDVIDAGENGRPPPVEPAQRIAPRLWHAASAPAL